MNDGGYGPTISAIMVSQANGQISWNAADPNGVASSALKIDGTLMSNVDGPWAAVSGVNYSCYFGNLPAGNHTYTIIATDGLGNVSTSTGTFTLASQTLTSIAVSPATATLNCSQTQQFSAIGYDQFGAAMSSQPTFTWSLTSGVGSIDATGLYTAPAADGSATISAAIGSISGSATVTVTMNGPTISAIMVSLATDEISWNTADPNGVVSSALKIDGTLMSNVDGPLPAASGVDYSCYFGNLSVGNHTYIIIATDGLDNVSTFTGTFTLVGTTNPGPTVSSVVVSQVKGRISWNAVDPDGAAGSTVKIDGISVSNVGGPYTATSGVNFSAPYGSLAAGSHSYIITAIDKLGNPSQYTGSFNVAANRGPTISGVVLVPAKGRMTWNAQDSDGVRSSSLTVDGTTVSKVYGPYAAASGVNFSGVFGTMSAGSHSYTITATDKLGNLSQYTGTFNVAAAASSGPMIGQVVVS